MNNCSAKITLHPYLNKKGKSSVVLQILIDRKKITLKTGVEIQPYLFNINQGCVKIGGNITKSMAQDYNLILNQCLAKANEVFIRARLGSVVLTPNKFKELYDSQTDYSHIDFIKFMDEEIKRLIGARTPSSIKSFRGSLNRLKKFRLKIMFDELKPNLIEDYDRFMTTDKLSLNSRSKHHKIFKTFINFAINRDIKITNPYTDFKIKRIKGNRDFLKPNNLDSLINLYNSNSLNIELQNVLEYFLFCCYTGLRISDIQLLTSDNIIGDILVFCPKKTRGYSKIVKVPLPDIAIDLIKEKEGKLFKTLTDQATNRALKLIACEANIEFNLTFHIARHTFATSFLRLGGSIEVLKKLLGHSKIETTMEYVHVMDETMIEQMQNFNKS